ncbi:MAG: CDP-alcohol phosphatidyltransferase family protein [bacterium]
MTEAITKKEAAQASSQESAREDPCGGLGASGRRNHGAVFTIPNLITFARLLLLIPLFYFLKRGEKGYGNSWALAVIGIALLTDILDGFLARVLRQATDWGRTFDPLTDKVWIAGLGIFLALPWRDNPLPWGFLLLVLLRDLLIVAGGIHIYRKRGVIPESNKLGKLAMFLTAVTLVFYTVNFAPPERFSWTQPQVAMWTSVIFLVASGLAYFARYWALIFSHPEPAEPSASSSTQMDS